MLSVCYHMLNTYAKVALGIICVAMVITEDGALMYVIISNTSGGLMTNFEEWRKAYYEVSMGNGPIVYCDDWTMPIDLVWISYVVMPHGSVWEGPSDENSMG